MTARSRTRCSTRSCRRRPCSTSTRTATPTWSTSATCAATLEVGDPRDRRGSRQRRLGPAHAAELEVPALLPGADHAISGTIYYKNIFQPPAAAFAGQHALDRVRHRRARGDRLHGPLTDGDDPTTNRHYVINDPDPRSPTPTRSRPRPRAADADGGCATGSPRITDITTVGTPVTSPRGYFFKAADGEKFVTTTRDLRGQGDHGLVHALAARGRAIRASTRARQRGSGNLYIFDLKTGVGDFQDGAGNEPRYTNIGSGLPTDPEDLDRRRRRRQQDRDPEERHRHRDPRCGRRRASAAGSSTGASMR